MATEAPWEVIRRAADLIERLAAAWVDGNANVEARAAKGWREPSAEGAYSWDQMVSGLVDEYFDEACGAAEKWTLAMSPAVAEPLVAWLRYIARRIEVESRIFTSASQQEALVGKHAHPIELARRILGEQP